MADIWDFEPGKVQILKPGEEPPTSSLVAAFQHQDDRAADAIVLRGYLGQSDIVKRTLEYLKRAKRIQEEEAKDEVVDKLYREGLEGYEPKGSSREPVGGEDPVAAALEFLRSRLGAIQSAEDVDVDLLIGMVDAFSSLAGDHIPWRLYLTPRLDRYVDFHRNSLLAFRREPKAERQDACTVWLRLFEVGERGRLPIPYRVYDVTDLGPSFAQWVGGDLVDDYLGQAGSSSTAWGDQSTAFGRKPGTGVQCGVFGRKPGTGVQCGE